MAPMYPHQYMYQHAYGTVPHSGGSSYRPMTPLGGFAVLFINPVVALLVGTFCTVILAQFMGFDTLEGFIFTLLCGAGSFVLSIISFFVRLSVLDSMKWTAILTAIIVTVGSVSYVSYFIYDKSVPDPPSHEWKGLNETLPKR